MYTFNIYRGVHLYPIFILYICIVSKQIIIIIIITKYIYIIYSVCILLAYNLFIKNVWNKKNKVHYYII